MRIQENVNLIKCMWCCRRIRKIGFLTLTACSVLNTLIEKYLVHLMCLGLIIYTIQLAEAGCAKHDQVFIGRFEDTINLMVGAIKVVVRALFSVTSRFNVSSSCYIQRIE